MNISVYLFGDLSSGYTQYPDDNKRPIFTTFYNNSQANTQIAIHRADNLMYYGYVRKLENSKYVGLCVVINGKMITRIRGLFRIFENTIELMVANGYLIHYNDAGEIVSKVGHLHKNINEITLITNSLRTSFNSLENDSQMLPPVSYGDASNSIKCFSVQDNEHDVVQSGCTNGYTFIYKERGYNTARMNDYSSVIGRQRNKINELRENNESLKAEISILKNKQRNTKLVAFLGFLVLVLFGIVYFKIINPAEVTKKNMGEYVYYGPMSDGEPNGIGVAIYNKDDKDGRLYYYGNFLNGKRIDRNAIMFYKDGSYFKGSMKEDKWVRGLFFDVENAHFVGEFKDNIPWNGDWYKHIKEQTIENGQ